MRAYLYINISAHRRGSKVATRSVCALIREFVGTDEREAGACRETVLEFFGRRESERGGKRVGDYGGGLRKVDTTSAFSESRNCNTRSSKCRRFCKIYNYIHVFQFGFSFAFFKNI